MDARGSFDDAGSDLKQTQRYELGGGECGMRRYGG